MQMMSDLIRQSKDAHMRSTGRIPLHVYIPTWVRDRLRSELSNMLIYTGTELADLTITHVHGMQIHVLGALDYTDVACSVTEEPV